MAKPFIPDCYHKIQSFMNISHNSFELDINKFKNTKINKPKIIFKRIPDTEIRNLKARFG